MSFFLIGHIAPFPPAHLCSSLVCPAKRASRHKKITVGGSTKDDEDEAMEEEQEELANTEAVEPFLGWAIRRFPAVLLLCFVEVQLFSNWSSRIPRWS
ncbi:hypothetical protein AOLI_G00162780 [Acnodon oligacanthus]